MTIYHMSAITVENFKKLLDDLEPDMILVSPNIKIIDKLGKDLSVINISEEKIE